ncbi:MAG TPA: hypothetical protein VFL62_25175 [Bradyrhizobium sp.]|uniref:hypothetical protein n=1 Tax=Bradyrhizobium sp. TaxID=376 RepID=UPI002D7E99E3|nr:hypothetical protein [Bradyrhizobium sp.]HET7889536.1 hypothetical protein [Bradyrhizobium sp.]
MDNPTIDHTRAICEEIGERLRILLQSSQPEDEAGLDDKLHRLSEPETEPTAAN